MMLIHEISKLTGLSIRTLHYYHELGLVVPQQHAHTRYRIYSAEHLKQLEHITFFKELGFSLKDIQIMLQNKSFKSVDAFQLQHRALLAKKRQLDEQISKIEHFIAQERRGVSIMPKQTNVFSMNAYEQEARKKWGNTAVDESLFKLSHLSEAEQILLKQKWDHLFLSLSKLIQLPVNSVETETLIAAFYKLLNDYFGSYNYQAFIGLGQLYVYDERFTTNIDKYGNGLTAYISEAMVAWGNKQLKNKT